MTGFEQGPMSEVGRELALSELTPRRLVAIAPPGRRFMVSGWVQSVERNTVTFFLGAIRVHFLTFIRDGKLFDDEERQVRVFEYLGKP
jgi:hypothetical protein